MSKKEFKCEENSPKNSLDKKFEDMFNFPKCTKKAEKGKMYKLRVSDLKPTQNGVGFDEIVKKREKLKKKKSNKEKLESYLVQRPIPIIIGNNGNFYLIDHHHLAYTVWKELGDIYLPVEVVQNWDYIKGYDFWKAMRENNWLYPFSGDGAGPLPPKDLKTHIKDLENDIFRSLSWFVRKSYGYLKSSGNVIFAEFKWANFYRSRIIFNEQLKENMNIKNLTLCQIQNDDPEDFEELMKLSISLASTHEARGLPGYRGN